MHWRTHNAAAFRHSLGRKIDAPNNRLASLVDDINSGAVVDQFGVAGGRFDMIAKSDGRASFPYRIFALIGLPFTTNRHLHLDGRRTVETRLAHPTATELPRRLPVTGRWLPISIQKMAYPQCSSCKIRLARHRTRGFKIAFNETRIELPGDNIYRDRTNCARKAVLVFGPAMTVRSSASARRAMASPRSGA